MTSASRNMIRQFRYFFLLLFFSFVQPSFSQEPAVGGKTKSEWIALLKDANPRKREAAVVALGILGAKDRNVQELYRELMLNEPIERVRLKAVLVVQDLEKDQLRQLIPSLADLLKGDKSPVVRAAAAGALGKSGDLAKTVINVLIDAFKDSDIAVRTAAADAVGRIGEEGKTAVPGLTNLLKDADSGVRLASVFALGRVGPEGANSTTSLASLLSTDPDANVRKESARSIGLLGLDAKAAIPALTKSLKEDMAVEVRQQSAIALSKMVGQLKPVAANILEVLKTDADKAVRVLAIQALSSGLASDLKDHISELTVQFSKEPEGEVRLAIVQELGNLGPNGKDALPLFTKATTDVQITIREAAKAAIKKVKG